MSHSSRPSAFLLAAAAGSSLLAQTPIGGSVSGNLPAGVYVATSSLTVPVGQTWTLAAGAIVKFQTTGLVVTVQGNLVTNGTAANPVVFTSYHDDSAGGDTDGNGPSTGAPTAWCGIDFRPGSQGSLLYADVRYGGSGYFANVSCTGASPTLSHCTLRDNYSHGMRVDVASSPTVSDCTFTNNGGFAVEGLALRAVPGFANNVASGNVVNAARVVDGAVTGNLTLGPAAMLTGAISIDTQVTVAAGATLTLQAGTILKFLGGHQLSVAGTLNANGLAGNPVVCTSFADDSAGGDTNTNGPSVGAPTGWQGIVFTPGGGGTLQYADVRYGGYGYTSNVVCNAASPTLQNCTLRHCYTHGMALSGAAFPTVTACTFANNGGYAIEGLSIRALAGLSNNVATGNAVNTGHVTNGTVAGVLTVPAAAMIGGAVSIDTVLAVPVGATLQVQAGTVLKFQGGYPVAVDGTLHVAGTAAAPVVFTGFADDSAGGDTNTNGPSVGAPTAWQGIQFSASGGGLLQHADVRFCGYNYSANVVCGGSGLRLQDCILRDGYTHGMVVQNGAHPQVERCSFLRNGGYAVEGLAIHAVPGFVDNTASGNQRNSLRIVDGTVVGNPELGAESLLGGGLLVANQITVPAGTSLTLRQGVVLKFEGGHPMSVLGSLFAKGTAYEPVVLTDDDDDAFGGDTNSNGPGVGGPAAWQGLSLAAGAVGSLENVRIRFGGYNYVPGLSCVSPNVALRSVRTDRCYDRGMSIAGSFGDAVNLVAWGCGGIGIHVQGGGNLVHATSSGNNVGIRAEAAWSGNVLNSISHGNVTNFANLAANRVAFSDGGFAGSNGNLDVAPQFVAPAQGDLRLQAGSPVLGMADVLQAFLVIKDHDENSRILDDALLGLPLPDMGAYERSAWDMAVVGDSSVGGSLQWTVQGQPGLSFYVAGFLNDGILPLVPYGILTCGSQLGTTVVGLTPVPVLVGQSFSLPVPNDAATIGFQIGIQTLTVPLASTAVGNVTRLHRVLIRP